MANKLPYKYMAHLYSSHSRSSATLRANKTNTMLLQVITDRRGCWKVANTCGGGGALTNAHGLMIQYIWDH